MAGFFKRLSKPKAQISLTLDRNTLSLNDELKGTLEVITEEKLNVEAIMVVVTGIAPNALRSDTSSDRLLWRIMEKVSQSGVVLPRYSQRFPFSIRIPSKPILTEDELTGIAGWFNQRAGPEAWLKKHPEWRERIVWVAKGVITVKGRRNIESKPVELNVTLPPVTQEERKAIKARWRYHLIAIVGGLLLIGAGFYLKMTDVTNGVGWVVVVLGGGVSLMWGWHGLPRGTEQ